MKFCEPVVNLCAHYHQSTLDHYPLAATLEPHVTYGDCKKGRFDHKFDHLQTFFALWSFLKEANKNNQKQRTCKELPRVPTAVILASSEIPRTKKCQLKPTRSPKQMRSEPQRHQIGFLKKTVWLGVLIS